MADVRTTHRGPVGYSTYSDQMIYDFESSYGAHHYSRQHLVVRKAEGIWLHDEKGDRYLDCLAAYSAVNQGHHHPRIVQAVVEALQSGYGSVISNVVYTDPLGVFLKKLATLVPQMGPRFGDNGNKVLPKNGGVESVETAVKLARYYGYKEKGIPDGQQEIVVFNNNFHGRMITTVSFSSNAYYKQGFGPLTPGFRTVDFGSLDKVEKAITKNTCGILVEPMQGEGGMYQAPAGFLKGLRELSDRHNLILLFDEIQVGLGRTGKMFAFEHEGVVPDGIILGKALSGGLVPLSCFVTNAKLMDIVFQPGRDGSTYGGYPLACVAGNAALDVIVEERLPENADQVGAYLAEQIRAIGARSPHVKEVRARGLFIGIEVKNGDAMKYCREMLGARLMANDSHGHTIRISPPLIITKKDADFIAAGLERVLV
ncbi:MAG TPA: aspartate aminotransferase family protein [candidate division Zixibacteria bacterium]|nr:aspartate aminotransferase family protein [candidate division Zixibacteria bacterium]MDD4916781.1 aspartate aminotransferase family protein [candidate division Zixibacteria bacterium]MDM7974161.1 aspartate aminotransferase family protein [candidate division Zixibacteria bacterium]HOD66120.1 aspartate aminotransferase family protein [candidate division Zixibacteria bacterium]HOZ07482.1 aspartate aminotransferase family protein [candidate division Zixibacteria bacterium]